MGVVGLVCIVGVEMEEVIGGGLPSEMRWFILSHNSFLDPSIRFNLLAEKVVKNLPPLLKVKYIAEMEHGQLVSVNKQPLSTNILYFSL